MRYLKAGIAGIVLNILLSLAQTSFGSGSETDAIVDGFLRSSPTWIIAIFYCSLIIAVPVFEEIIFRGGLWKLISRFGNDKIAAVLVALIFSFLHSWEAGLFLLPFSAYLSYLRYNHGNIWHGVIAHICFNATALTLLPKLF